MRWPDLVPGSTLARLAGVALLLGASAPVTGQKVTPVASSAMRVRAATGSVVTLGPDGPFPPGTSFHWNQVEGPPVAIGDASAARIRFHAPKVAGQVGFELAIRGDGKEKTSRILVTVAAEPGDSSEPVADAGDDQIGLVGRRITLNGSRSRPSGGVGFRWIQVSGPPVAEMAEDGGYLSFEPTGPGDHRFVLVVAAQNQISLPDFVTVEVGVPAGPRPFPAAEAPVVASVTFVANESNQLLTTAVASAVTLSSGTSTCAEVGDVLDAVAERIPVYKTFGELQSELSRRLNVIVPISPAARSAWNSQVFAPLSQIIGTELTAMGIDPRPRDSAPEFDVAQKNRLQTVYRGLATAFHTSSIKK